MDDNAPKENPPADFNKLDLSQLQSFSFGTQWTQDKSAPSDRRERRDEGERPRREDRREGSGPDRRDRRSFRRPAGPGGGEGGGAGAGAGGGAPERREFSGDRRPRREGGGGEYRGGPRREGGERGPRYGYGREPQQRGPYESPFYNVTFYPEDTSFNTLVQTIRKSCRTVELFEIARTVVAKTDRFVVVVAHKAAPAPEALAAGTATPGAPKGRQGFFISVPDGMPFETEEAAVAHVLSKHLDKFFDMAEVEVDPPKGNFQVINKCSVTGELLGPPNYHRYNQIVQQHHATKLPRMPFEAFKSRIETIRDPEVVNQWLAKMKKTTRYTWKTSSGAKPAAQPVASETPVAATPASSEGAAASAEPTSTNPPADATPAAAAEPVATPAPAGPTFDALEEARLYLLSHAREKVVRPVEHVRVHGKIAEQLPQGEIRHAIEGALERQRRFPLDTANALRGRLRREHFTIFKKGSKGVSYVCAVKRKFRVPGQTFSDSIGALISFIEANPMTRASELQTKFLGIAPTPEPKPADGPVPPAADASGEGAAKAEVAADAAAGTPVAPPAEPAKPEPVLSIEDRARLSRLQGDLMWLVREGYVTEFIDGRLFAPPPMVEARKKEIESEEHDPENFPEAPAAEAAPAPAETPPAPAESTAENAPEAGNVSAPEAPASSSEPASPGAAEDETPAS
jgi:hypothetical protein